MSTQILGQIKRLDVQVYGSGKELGLEILTGSQQHEKGIKSCGTGEDELGTEGRNHKGVWRQVKDSKRDEVGATPGEGDVPSNWPSDYSISEGEWLTLSNLRRAQVRWRLGNLHCLQCRDHLLIRWLFQHVEVVKSLMAMDERKETMRLPSM